MAETVVLTTQKREGRGSHRADKLRKQGLIPGVLYGHKQATVSLAVSSEELSSAIRHGARVVELKTDAGNEQALIRELQWDHLGKDLLHVDFSRVSKDERIVVPVRIELRGIAPGVTGGGILDQQMHALNVECLAIAVPESIRVSIAELQQGMSVHVRDVKVPEGVKVMDDPDAIVVSVAAPRVAVEAPAAGAAVPAAEQAEPEVITRRPAAEEGEAEKK
jgi:large subunit ribosomal protein L25